jgi:hypothetical protein
VALRLAKRGAKVAVIMRAIPGEEPSIAARTPPSLSMTAVTREMSIKQFPSS